MGGTPLRLKQRQTVCGLAKREFQLAGVGSPSSTCGAARGLQAGWASGCTPGQHFERALWARPSGSSW